MTDPRPAKPCPHATWEASFPGQPYADAACAKCWLWHNDPDGPAVRAWKGHKTPPGKSPTRPLPVCPHEGPIIERCTRCGPAGELNHVRDCGHPDNPTERCTRGPNNGAVWSCESCPHHPAAFPPVARRNLLFHLHPVPGAWRWHTARLRDFLSLFDGRRVVAVTTGKHPTDIDVGRGWKEGKTGWIDLDPPASVRAELPGCEVIEVPNDPTRGEVATFLPLFESVASDTDPGSVTLYAHSKGVCRPPADTARRWAEMLYETMFCWPAVEAVLTRHPVAGSFLKVGRGFKESTSDWHYSGSWFWFRNAELFGKPDWRRIDGFWSGIEPYPSLHFPLSDAGCVFHRGTVPHLDLYSWPYLTRTVEPALTAWQREHAGRKTTFPVAPPVAAIDVDDTLTAFPGEIVPLTKRLRSAGWRVVFLTGGLADPSIREAAITSRKIQIDGYGPEYDGIEVCLGPSEDVVADLKAAWCRDHRAALLLDDNPKYCARVRAAAPACRVVRVAPGFTAGSLSFGGDQHRLPVAGPVEGESPRPAPGTR